VDDRGTQYPPERARRASRRAAAASRLLIIGGAEDRCCGSGVLERFAKMCGGGKARLVLVTTATGRPGQVLDEYEQVFRKLGVRHVRELPIRGRADADGSAAAATLDGATGVFFSGGDQSRLQTLVGSRINDQLRRRLGEGLVVAGTSAGATALGRTMILGGHGAEVSTATVRTAPGLGLLPRALIDMHFGERGRLPRLLSAVALDPDRLGIGIDENTAICVQQDTFEVLGSGAVTVVDAQRAPVVHAASDSDPITLFDVRLHLLPAGCVFDLAARAPAVGPAHARY
jgi:cyanophycinase